MGSPGFYAGNEPVPFVTACRSHARGDKKPEAHHIRLQYIGQFYAGHKLLAVVKTAEVFVTNLRRRSEANQTKVTLALLLEAVQKGKKIVR